MIGDEETQGFMPGPLDELVPGLRRKSERWPALPVHPRILEAERDDGSRNLVMASFAPAANLKTYHAALKPLVEASLLSELSRPVEELRERTAALRGLELYAFAQQPFDPAPALSTFGLSSAPIEGNEVRRTLGLLRRECQLVDGLATDEPLARYTARVVASEQALCGPLAEALLERTEGPFGAEPGALARELCSWLDAQGFRGVAPTRGGIERLESLILHQTPFVIRWIDPIVFQALCDLIAVAAITTWKQEVEWGVCEADEETLVSPPPVIRVNKDRDTFHVPLGEHVLRWCIMPTQVGESIPSLGSWAEHEFTG
ncbi:MAG: hypothetical protein QM778_01690 [Myxococcales bacterium]